ncbi:hypothetical protein Rs2_23537 [Raphanus sativus]|uniref:Plant UBX domain-containing protein 5 n=1 Tax=Raphanus sativus TaxID=3726 RepID=A0A6J0P117_RAPSA|nr:plant UBX domain-containing protein 5 [Raphanus sativus]KAJ4896743.1 hypothetical protein Rs2_23537 [Raphanus sativus]
MDDDHKKPPTMEEIHEMMISSFMTKITSSSRQVARVLLEAHQWDVDAAVSGFNDANSVAVATNTADGWRNVANPRDPRLSAARTLSSILRVDIPVSSSPPSSPIRLRSPRSPSRARHHPFSRETIQSDEQKHDVDDTAEESDDVERAPPLLPSSLPRRLKFRSMSEILSVIPQVITRIVTVWRNGLTLDDNPLWTFDDPLSKAFLEKIESLESPRAVDSRDGKQRFLVKIIRRQQEDYPGSSSPKPFQPFYGVARTLAKSDDTVSTEPPASSDSVTTEPTPSADPTAPTTSIQLVLADGTRLNSRFNTHHTIRDVRDFIDAARPDASRDYQLLIMGTFPPKPLTDLDQTIEQAGISNSVLTQKP